MLTLKTLGSAQVVVAVLSLGTYSAEAAAKPHGHHVRNTSRRRKTNCILLVRDTLSAVPLGIATKATRPN